jgi:DNA replication and repair protein RecF
MEHKPHLQYQTFCEPSEDIEEIKKRYGKALDEARDNELDRELTTVGPHRDEIVFYLDDFELRKFGSQGQHRLFALSIKLAQLFYFSEHLDELPIFLLDDVFGDLDTQRTEVLLQALIEHAGQTFITSASPVLFDQFVTFDGVKNRKYTIKRGEVTAR